jgi:geranylgeranyl reductase family protein
VSESTVECEVLVIGAGPAGATAAAHLATAGVDVLLVDQSDFPRDKVCGDLLGGQSLVELARLGIHPAERWAGRCTVVERWFATSHQGSERGGAFELGLGPGEDELTYMVRRWDLDDGLRRRALQAGARWLSPCRCTERTPVVSGRVTVRATGPSRRELSVSARAVICAWGSVPGCATPAADPADERVLVAGRCYMAGVDLPPRTEEIHYLDHLPVNYLWIFPLPDGMANVGVVLPLKDLRRAGLRLGEHFRRVLAPIAAARPCLAGARVASPFRTTLLRTGFEPGLWCEDAVLYAGDAAGTGDPLNGEGIGPAMVSGRLAAEVLVDALARGGPVRREDLAGYERGLTGRYGDRYAWASEIARRRSELVRLVAAS